MNDNYTDGNEISNSAIANLKAGPPGMQQERKTIVRPIYSKVEGEVFHNFIQVCNYEGCSIGEKMAQLVEEYSRKQFPGKKPYDVRFDLLNLNTRR